MRLETQAARRIRKLETALKDARTEAREQAYQIQRLRDRARRRARGGSSRPRGGPRGRGTSAQSDPGATCQCAACGVDPGLPRLLADRGARVSPTVRPVTTRDRGRSSGSVSPRSRASREPAFVRGARCSSSRPAGRGRDRHPREEDELCHTNASRLVPPDPGRSQLPTGDDSGRGHSEGRRDDGLAARRVETRCPRASEPSSGPQRVPGRPHERCLIRAPPALENARRPPCTHGEAKNWV
jgi:hypothetical protein